MIPATHGCLQGNVRYVRKQWSEEAHGWKETLVEESELLAAEPSVETQHPFTWKARGHGPDDVEIIINCSTLRGMIAEQIDSWPHHHEALMRLYYPFPEIIHNWDLLRETAAKASLDDPCQAHLANLLDVIEKSKVLRYYFEQRKQSGGNTPAATSFHDLNKVFYPGQLVFATPGDVPQVFLVHDCGYRNFRKRPANFQVHCWTYGILDIFRFCVVIGQILIILDFTGREFTRLHYKLSIDRFEKSKLVKNLRFYPLDHHDEKEQIEKLLLDRGEKFRRYCIKSKGHQMLDYDGDVSFISRRPEDLFGEEYGRYVVMGGMLRGALEKNSDSESDDDDDVCNPANELAHADML